jgi:cysteinyl-tRNA synthetase
MIGGYGSPVLRLFDTASGEVGELKLRSSGQASLYVCGPTVYELPHLGHGRTMLVYDVLRRHLEANGVSVNHVSNVTDIDDKIIDRARNEQTSTEVVAERYEQAWWRASDALGVLRPSSVPHATAYVDQMVELIAELVDGGHAYQTPDGVYLEVAKVPGYGLLKHQDLDELLAGARVGPIDAKRSSGDFALWKLAKPGEPSWPSPFGAGRPGWHTECVVMSLDLLGEGFDLHTGGADLIFPHHENERAQAVALSRRFAGHWMHHAFVTDRGGEKMARSLGNFTTLDDLLAGSDSRSYRLLVLRSQYRQPMEVTAGTISQAQEALSGLDAMARRLVPEGPEALPVGPSVEVLARWRAAMDDDLDSPNALAGLFEARRQANALADQGDLLEAASVASAVVQCSASVGLFLEGVRTLEAPSEVVALMAQREAARGDRDFARADAIRASIAEVGWVVEDTPQGPRLHRNRPD